MVKIVQPTAEILQGAERFQVGVSEGAQLGRPKTSDATRFSLDAADAYVFEPERSQTGGIEKILGVDNDGLLQKMLNAIEI